MKKYKVKLKFSRPILGGKPTDPFVFLQHKVEAARKAIAKWATAKGKDGGNSKDKKALPFLNAMAIEDSNVQRQLEGIRSACEFLLSGEKITDNEWEDALAGNLGKNTVLYARLIQTRGVTIFVRDKKGFPYWDDYVMKGFFKDLASVACQRNSSKRGTFLQGEDYSQGLLNKHFFIKEYKTFFYDDRKCTKKRNTVMNDDNTSYKFQRTLRAKTAQGDRIALASSEMVNENCYIQFTIIVMHEKITKAKIKEVLEVGELYGASQWRNAGYGRFDIVELK